MAEVETVEATEEATEEVTEETPEEATEEVTEETTEEITEETAEEVTEETTTEEEPIQLVYVGPSLPRERLRNAQILRGTQSEIDKFLSGMSEKYPELSHLLVTPDKLTAARKKVQDKNSILHKYYEDVAAKARASRKGY